MTIEDALKHDFFPSYVYIGDDGEELFEDNQHYFIGTVGDKRFSICNEELEEGKFYLFRTLQSDDEAIVKRTIEEEEIKNCANWQELTNLIFAVKKPIYDSASDITVEVCIGKQSYVKEIKKPEISF